MYASSGITEDVLRELLPLRTFTGVAGVDICCGAGEILQTLTRMGASVTGVDWNPFFVHNARAKGLAAVLARADECFDSFAAASGIGPGSQDFAISTLAMDRVARPRRLLANLFAVLREGGHFAVQTLLPITPVDDVPVAEPIVYTAVDDRITHGRTRSGDEEQLLALLTSLGAQQVRRISLPYAVTSRDGVQEYEIVSFSGAKRAVADQSRMDRTGDLARFRRDGAVEFCGRVDHQVKISGFRIELGEIEHVLREQPQVTDAVVIVREDSSAGKRLVAYVVAAEGAIDVRGLRQALVERLPAYLVPSSIVRLDRLPLTVSGKVDRRALPRPETPRGEAATPATTPVEEAVCALAADLLMLRVTPDDNFFALGGDSIISIQLVGRLSRQGFRLTPRQVFEQPTFRALAAVAEEEHDDREVSESTGQAPATPIIRWLESLRSPINRFSQAVVVEAPEHVNILGLTAAVQVLLDHHDALRLRLVNGADGWSLSIPPAGSVAAERCVRRVPAARMRRATPSLVRDEIEAAAARLSPWDGIMLQVVWMDCGTRRGGQLLLVGHHLAVDGVSWGILDCRLAPRLGGDQHRRQGGPWAQEHGVRGLGQAARDRGVPAGTSSGASLLAGGA